VDEFVSIIVEQLAKAARDARQRQAGAAVATPPPPAPKAPPVAAVAPRPAPAQKRPAPPQPPPDPFAIVANPTAAASPNSLLAAFANKDGLLAGIVLGEALAPPLALRERSPGHS